MLLHDINEITVLYVGGCRNRYFEICKEWRKLSIQDNTKNKIFLEISEYVMNCDEVG